MELRLSRVGLAAGFREQIAAGYAVRFVEARPDPLPGLVARLASTIPQPRPLSQREPEEMFLLPFQRALGMDATSAHLEIFHRAYSEAQSHAHFSAMPT